MSDEETTEHSNEIKVDSAAERRLLLEKLIGYISEVDPRHWTELHLVAAGRITCAPDYYEHLEEDINVRGPDGYTPLMVASFCGGVLDDQVRSETIAEAVTEIRSGDIFNNLLMHGADISAKTDSTGETSLHLTARYAHGDVTKRLLEAGCDPNFKDIMGRTPLHTSVTAGSENVFQILLHHQATLPDSQMNDGTTPLILAVRLRYDWMVRELAKRDVNTPDNKPDDTYQRSTNYEIKRRKISGITDSIKFLLRDHLDNSMGHTGSTALHWAAKVNNYNAVVTLLQHGANPDAQNTKGQTPLFLAAKDGYCEVARVLLDFCASCDISDKKHRKPRDIALKNMHSDIITLLNDYTNNQQVVDVTKRKYTSSKCTPQNGSMHAPTKKTKSSKHLMCPRKRFRKQKATETTQTNDWPHSGLEKNSLQTISFDSLQSLGSSVDNKFQVSHSSHYGHSNAADRTCGQLHGIPESSSIYSPTTQFSQQGIWFGYPVSPSYQSGLLQGNSSFFNPSSTSRNAGSSLNRCELGTTSLPTAWHPWRLDVASHPILVSLLNERPETPMYSSFTEKLMQYPHKEFINDTSTEPTSGILSVTNPLAISSLGNTSQMTNDSSQYIYRASNRTRSSTISHIPSQRANTHSTSRVPSVPHLQSASNIRNTNAYDYTVQQQRAMSRCAALGSNVTSPYIHNQPISQGIPQTIVTAAHNLPMPAYTSGPTFSSRSFNDYDWSEGITRAQQSASQMSLHLKMQSTLPSTPNSNMHNSSQNELYNRVLASTYPMLLPIYLQTLMENEPGRMQNIQDNVRGYDPPSPIPQLPTVSTGDGQLFQSAHHQLPTLPIHYLPSPSNPTLPTLIPHQQLPILPTHQLQTAYSHQSATSPNYYNIASDVTQQPIMSTGHYVDHTLACPWSSYSSHSRQRGGQNQDRLAHSNMQI